MNNIRTKIAIVRKLLDEAEKEYHFTKLLMSLSSNHRTDFENCLPETVYFNLIKHIIDQNNLPNNVDGINVHVDHNNQITICEFISFLTDTIAPKHYVNIICDK